MPSEMFATGDQLQVGDVILTRAGKAGAVLMERMDEGLNQSCWFMTDKNVIAPYRREQSYAIIRTSHEELEDAMSEAEQPYDPKHGKEGKGDAQERADVLRQLPTYQSPTKYDEATKEPAEVRESDRQ